MKYKCLVFDHDDTVVNSTATIHHPSFQKYLLRYFPEKTCDLQSYFLKNFNPGFIAMCKDEFGMTDEDLSIEVEFWRAYVKEHIPAAYPGMRELMEHHVEGGGIICVVSHSYEDFIMRDWAANGLPSPAAVFGWGQPVERRKPNPWPLQEIMRQFSLKRGELLMIDDLKPGYDMAKACGVDFAGAGWANDIPEIEQFMRANCENYFKDIAALASFVG